MILDDCGAGRCLGAGSPRSVDRVDGTVGALKEGRVLDPRVESPLGGQTEAKPTEPQNRERPALGCCLFSSIKLDFC